MQSYSNCAYMHGYCSIFVYMHNFASTDMSVFVVVKMCKINTFFFFGILQALMRLLLCSILATDYIAWETSIN